MFTQSSGAVCESRGGRPGLPVPDSPYGGLCGRKTTLNLNLFTDPHAGGHFCPTDKDEMQGGAPSNNIEVTSAETAESGQV